MNGKSIVGRVFPLQPSIGAGKNPMCERCVEKMKQDIDHQIVEILKTK